LFAGLIAASIGMYLYFENESRQREKRELQARSLIRSSDVEFQSLVMSESYGFWKIKGLVKNNSRYPIERIKLMVEVIAMGISETALLLALTTTSLVTSISLRGKREH
jgi:hypothetical protein